MDVNLKMTSKNQEQGRGVEVMKSPAGFYFTGYNHDIVATLHQHMQVEDLPIIQMLKPCHSS